MSSLEFNSRRIQTAGRSVHLTKKRILAAAELVFSRDGFQGATTREIARQAGVNEVTVFRHFRTRDELLRATPICRGWQISFTTELKPTTEGITNHARSTRERLG
jgi:predicted transcriptional regulator